MAKNSSSSGVNCIADYHHINELNIQRSTWIRRDRVCGLDGLPFLDGIQGWWGLFIRLRYLFSNHWGHLIELIPNSGRCLGRIWPVGRGRGLLRLPGECNLDKSIVQERRCYCCYWDQLLLPTGALLVLLTATGRLSEERGPCVCYWRDTRRRLPLRPTAHCISWWTSTIRFLTTWEDLASEAMTSLTRGQKIQVEET